MKYVAFLRNVNLGQPRSPTRAQLETAFLQAGAETAASFLSNGTLVFSVQNSLLAQTTAGLAGEILRQVCGMTEPIFVRDFQRLAGLVAENPFSGFVDSSITERAMAFFEPLQGEKVTAPFESERKDCLVFRIDRGDALCIVRQMNGKIGYPTPVLEKALKRPVTTRSWTTIMRLVDRHG